MTKPAIKVEGLWKEYVVGHAQQQHGTFYDLHCHFDPGYLPDAKLTYLPK